jgi:outer membrane protein OmpA-like peptidoglycan-associated protein
MVSLLATVAMMGTGVASMMGCAEHAQVAVQTPPVPEVVVPAPPAVVVAAPPPAPRLTTVCDAEIRPQGHIKFPHEVEFDEGKATIKSTPTTSAILQCLVDFLGNNAMVTKFRIEGHTDNRGDAAMNQALSQARAEAIVAWLTAHNVTSAKVWAKGYGPTRPLVPNDSPDNMAKNRRVEFHIDELNGAKATKEAIALALNPPATVAVTSVAVPAPQVVGVSVATPSVSVAVPQPSVGVSVAVPAVATGVSVATPGVSVGVGFGGGASVGGGGGKPGAGPAKKEDKKAAPEKKEEKKDEKK